MRPLLLLLTLLLPLAAPAAEPLHHRLEVTLRPADGTLEAVDTITLPAGTAAEFLLHRGLEPHLEGAGRLRRLGEVEGAVPLERFRVEGTGQRFTLRYGGTINHPLEAWSGKRGKVERATPAEIAPTGVFLSGAGGWYPRFGDRLLAFELTVHLPDGWHSVSQGAETEADHWSEAQPQDDLYLLAYPYHLYRAAGPHGEARVYLREADEALAERYLEATREYLDLYSNLIGPYPYAKFALVENRWESGYGMPSFTLLGPRVLRLPFILRSAYPHEILHNWWGNGVFVDYREGNWSEGLTAYLADHLMQERAGHGAAYRREQLQRYAEYVKRGEDRPLSEFRARHGEASQALGYGKSAMFFHMLRRRLGDASFLAGLRRFYAENRFRRAAFDDLRRAFEAASGEDLGAFFKQWLERPGAPELTLGEARADGDALEITLHQKQPGAAYRLEVPIALRLAGRDAPWRTRLTMTEATQRWRLELPAKPLRLEVDPEFDLFRRLLPGERPAALAQLFGAERLLLVYPAAGASSDGYRRLAKSWAAGDPAVEVTSDATLERLPEGRAVWLMGWENRFLERIKRRLGERVEWLDDGLVLDGERLTGGDWSVVLATPAIGWLATRRTEALPGLARKLPHYGKYGYLAFSGDAPTIHIKGEWPVLHSPLSRVLGPGGEVPVSAESSRFGMSSRERISSWMAGATSPSIQPREELLGHRTVTITAECTSSCSSSPASPSPAASPWDCGTG
ncbi:M1 family metallopeptidase [Endothiovibrio diazotrophicus]